MIDRPIPGAPAGIQSRLNKITQTEKFAELLCKEVEQRGLDLKLVRDCIPSLYHLLSKFGHGNLGVLVIRKRDFVPSERALLVTIMRVQEEWADPLQWIEDLEG